MENTPSSDVWTNVTAFLSEDDVQTPYLATLGHLSLKIIYSIIGTVDILDNLFVVMIFALFIHITDKVLTLSLKHLSTIATRPRKFAYCVYFQHFERSLMYTRKPCCSRETARCRCKILHVQDLSKFATASRGFHAFLLFIICIVTSANVCSINMSKMLTSNE